MLLFNLLSGEGVGAVAAEDEDLTVTEGLCGGSGENGSVLYGFVLLLGSFYTFNSTEIFPNICGLVGFLSPRLP